MDDDSDITLKIPSGQKVSWTHMEGVAKKCAPGDLELRIEALSLVSRRLLERERKIENLDHYVARAIRNTILTLRKKRQVQKKREVQQEGSSFSLTDLEDSLRDSQQLAEDAIIAAEFFRQVEEALKTETGKAVWTLCLDGWEDQGEIAEEVGCSRQTVNKYIKKIRKIIEEIDPSKVPPPKGGGGGGRRSRKRRRGVLPPARADPLFWVNSLNYDQNTTVASGVEETRKEMNNEERSKVDTMGRTAEALPSGGQPSHDQRRVRRRRVIGDLKRLLLQLPAFRDDDNAAAQEEVKNLEGVLGKVLGSDLDDGDL